MMQEELKEIRVGKEGNFNIKIAPIIRFEKIIEKITIHADIRQNTISPKKLKWILTRYNLPQETIQRVVNEMIALKLIKRNNKRELEIINHAI